MARRDPRRAIDVEVDHLHPAGVDAAQRLDHRPDTPAPPASLGPEVDQDRHRATMCSSNWSACASTIDGNTVWQVGAADDRRGHKQRG
jgi:hypothetical protein